MPKPSVRAQWAAHLKAKALGKPAPAGSPVPLALARKAFRGVILGIDPSLRGTGLTVLAFDPPRKVRYIASETVNPPKTAELPECLGCIAGAVERMIRDHQPAVVAVEETIYVQNLRTAQKLGAARGAAIGQAALHALPVFEYPPLRVKQAVVGYGRAGKEQMARQMASLLGMAFELPFDEADAAAVALCHALTRGREA